MDSMDNPNANLPARLPASLPRLPAQISMASRELVPATPSSSINPKQLLRGLIRNWRWILLIWIVLAAPLTYLVYRFVEPNYLASAQILVESKQPELFDHTLTAHDGSQPSYLQTEIETLRGNSVLEKALQNPELRKYPLVKESPDVKAEIRKNLMMMVIPGTNYIKVMLESKDPMEAKDIVNAVVNSYILSKGMAAESGSMGKSIKDFNKNLKDSLNKYSEKLQADIQDKRKKLRDLAGRGNVEFNAQKPGDLKNEDNDPDMQSLFNKESLELYKTTKDHLMQTEFQILELEAQLSAKQAQEQPGQTPSDTPALASNDALRERIVQEFRRDPDVASLIEQIKSTTEELEHIRGVVRKGADPSRMALHNRLAALKKDYNELWNTKSEQIHQRLLVPTSATGVPEFDSIGDIRRKLETLKVSKSKLMDLINKFDVKKQDSHRDAVDATFLREDLSRDFSMFDQLDRKLRSLEFNQDKAGIHIGGYEEAELPMVPNANKRLRYMALLPLGLLCAIVGVFLLLEVRAERVADPDMLSSRVQSEVYALPPLPTAKAARKLNGPTIDDQIERFIQRLDHLRFAVCGDQHHTELGRCVLVTSAVGGEGKTTLAAQLAARCGNAGVSTLLIDADLRRASLCPLLDVPEGPGLSDVLDGVVKVEDVVIPVQGGTFHLLCAGTPIPDTSRIFQGRNLPMLIAELRQRYDLIFIDSPPILPVPDALILGRWADGALLAARFEVSRSPQVERARRQLDSAGIPVLGTVINGMRSSDAYYGRYSYDRQRAAQSDPSTAT